MLGGGGGNLASSEDTLGPLTRSFHAAADPRPAAASVTAIAILAYVDDAAASDDVAV